MTRHAQPVLLAAVLMIAAPAAAQSGWDALVAGSDSFGPAIPAGGASPYGPCGPGIAAPDSIQVSSGHDEYVMSARSQRTRGYRTAVRTRPSGNAVFALREVRCEAASGRPIEFLIEKEHRYFEILFIHEPPSYRAIRFRSPEGTWDPPEWRDDTRTFGLDRPAGAPVALVSISGTCGLSAGGQIYCWGAGRDSAGAEFPSRARRLRQPPGARFERIAGSCAVQAWGQAHCWNSGRPIPAGQTSDTVVAVNQRNAQTRLAQWDGSCGVTLEGRLYCYDLHLDGLMGPGSHDEPRSLLPQPLDLVFVEAAMASDELCGLTEEGGIHCLSIARGHEPDRRFRQIVLPGGVAAARFEPGPCVLTTDGARVCWSPVDPPLPETPGVRFVQLAPAGGFDCALTDRGQAYCWGDNDEGQLGNGSRDGSAVPVRVRQPRGVSFVELTSGDDYACGLGHDGAAYCWGGNRDGQLGDGTTESRSVPVQVLGTGGGRAVARRSRSAPMTVPRRLYAAARRALASGDTAGFVASLTRSAEAGYAPAQNDLGELFEYGRGVGANPTVAATWYRRAADQGDAPAQRNLGSLYQHGAGVERDINAAVTWYRRSADQDHGPGQNDLGYLYLHGNGVASDPIRAARLFRSAIDQGNSFAMVNLAHMLENGIGMARDLMRARQYYRSAAAAGNVEGARGFARLGGTDP